MFIQNNTEEDAQRESKTEICMMLIRNIFLTQSAIAT